MPEHQLTLKRGNEYLAQVLAERCPASARRHASSLRAYLRMLESRGDSTDDVCLHLPRLPEDATGQRLAPVDPDRFATLPPPASPKAVRDFALSALHELVGIPVGQLRALEVDDVDLEAGLLRLRGRRGREKLVMLSGPTAAGLRRWVAVRRVLGARDRALFISLHWTAGRSEPGTRMSCRGLSEALRQMRGELEELG